MATLQDVTRKLSQLGVNRTATEEDVANANKYGMDIFDRQFGGGTATDTSTGTTPGQAGQATPSTVNALPTLDTLKQQEQSLITQEAELSDQGQTAADVLGKLLEAKQKAAPYDRKIAQTKERIAAKTFSDYIDQGLSVDQGIKAMQQDIARANTQITYYDQQKQQNAESVAELIDSYVAFENQRLASLGLQITRTQGQIATQQAAQDQAIALAFSPATLLSGVMPPGVPPELIPTWEAQSNEAKRQLALSESLAKRSGGGSGGSGVSPYAFKLGETEYLIDKNTGQVLTTYSDPGTPTFDQFLSTRGITQDIIDRGYINAADYTNLQNEYNNFLIENKYISDPSEYAPYGYGPTGSSLDPSND